MFDKLASFFALVIFVPQAIKTIRTKDTHSLSFLTLCIGTAAMILWTVYGLQTGNYALVASNAINLPLQLIVLFSKVRNDLVKGGTL